MVDAHDGVVKAGYPQDLNVKSKFRRNISRSFSENVCKYCF